MTPMQRLVFPNVSTQCSVLNFKNKLHLRPSNPQDLKHSNRNLKYRILSHSAFIHQSTYNRSNIACDRDLHETQGHLVDPHPTLPIFPRPNLHTKIIVKFVVVYAIKPHARTEVLLHTFLTLALDGGWPASRPGRFTSGTRCIDGG
jgi:hypothetical protein